MISNTGLVLRSLSKSKKTHSFFLALSVKQPPQLGLVWKRGGLRDPPNHDPQQPRGRVGQPRSHRRTFCPLWRGSRVAVAMTRWTSLFVQSNGYNQNTQKTPLQSVIWGLEAGFVDKQLSLLLGRPGWGNPCLGAWGATESTLSLPCRPQPSPQPQGPTPLHLAGPPPRGGRGERSGAAGGGCGGRLQ